MSSSKPPCHFFIQGKCRNGDKCAFSHEKPSPSLSNGDSTSVVNKVSIVNNGPPPIIINTEGQPVYSLDVECVASGISHNARSVAQVAMVDEWNRPIFNAYIKQELPVFSYISELTGLTKEILDTSGQPLADTLAELRAHIPPNAILVGQNILKDIQWLQLAEGVDYASLIDISALLRVWNPAHGDFTTFSQDHCAKVWLGIPERKQHSALEDASISMALFNTYRSIQWDSVRLSQLQHATLTQPRVPGFSSRFPVVDNCWYGIIKFFFFNYLYYLLMCIFFYK